MCPPARQKSGRAPRAESASRRSGNERPSPRARRGHPVATARHLGRARLDAPAPNLPSHGPPISRSRRPLEQIPRRPAVLRPQRVTHRRRSRRAPLGRAVILKSNHKNKGGCLIVFTLTEEGRLSAGGFVEARGASRRSLFRSEE